MPTHYHVYTNDAGYLPDGEVESYRSFDEAWSAVRWHADAHIDYCLEVEANDSTLTVRGSDVWTFTEEAEDVQRQIDELGKRLDFARSSGLHVVLDAGLRVIQLAVCDDADCEDELTED